MPIESFEGGIVARVRYSEPCDVCLSVTISDITKDKPAEFGICILLPVMVAVDRPLLSRRRFADMTVGILFSF